MIIAKNTYISWSILEREVEVEESATFDERRGETVNGDLEEEEEEEIDEEEKEESEEEDEEEEAEEEKEEDAVESVTSRIIALQLSLSPCITLFHRCGAPAAAAAVVVVVVVVFVLLLEGAEAGGKVSSLFASSTTLAIW